MNSFSQRLIQNTILINYTISQNITGFSPPKITCVEIAEKVKVGSSPPYRPEVSKEVCSQQWHDLMTECWEEDPKDRLTFAGIKAIMKLINGGR